MPSPTSTSVPAPPAEAADVAVLLQHLVRIVRALRAQGQGDLSAGLTSALWTVITHGPLRMSELAARESVSLPTMSRVVTGLSDRGYLERTTDPRDARAFLLTATGSGEALLRHSGSQKAQALADALDRLDPATRESLGQGLSALADALTATTDP